MNNFIISYDLHQSGQNYERVIDYIKSYQVWAKIHQSVWYVKSSKSTKQIRDELLRRIDDNDSVFVAEIKNASWHNLPKDRSDYIIRHWNS